MRSLRSLGRLPALLLVLALLAAACGQKPGTHVATTGGVAGAGGELGAGDPGVLAEDPAAVVGAEDPAAAAGAAAPGAPAAATGGTGAAAARPGAKPGAAAPAAGGGAPGGASGAVVGSNRTGAPKDKLVLAVHAPVTGAAPLPAPSFEKARDLYWRWQTEEKKEKILGRSTVEVLFKDDRYQPNTAVQACRELGASAFMLVGGGGTDQIQACARYANQAKIPYLSAGVTENGVRGLPWYFAGSMSYKQQGPLLAKYISKTFPGKKVAAIITDTPNFDDAAAGWEAGVAAAGLNYYKTLRHPKGDTSWYNTFASELNGQGVEIVYINSAPVDYIRFAQQAKGQSFNFQFVGVGITMGLNPVLASGCDNVDGGIFFSPFPGLDWARTNVADFFAAAAKFQAPADDLGLALWGIAAIQHEMFKRYEARFGTDLTREGFRALVEQQKDLKTAVFPGLSFTPQDHFGANQVHVLKADCRSKTYSTLATFVSGF